MITYKKLPFELYQGTFELPNSEAHLAFSKVRNEEPAFLFESKPTSKIYGRFSLIGIDPILKISGKGSHFEIRVLTPRGEFFLKDLSQDKKLLSLCDDYDFGKASFSGTMSPAKETIEEGERAKQKNVGQVLRCTLELFAMKEVELFGLYGAIAYDFIRLFEDLEERLAPNEESDFEFFLFDTFIHFDLIREKTKIVLFRKEKSEIPKTIEEIQEKLKAKPTKKSYTLSQKKFLLQKKEYEELVRKAKNYAKKGEIFEVVFSNKLTANFSGDPFSLYLAYRDSNPSPYLFFFDLGKEQLVGASPEMMVRVEGRTAHLRPISGTIKRDADPIQDHENLIKLLSAPKERAELDMLIDLGRNDLSRVCKPGIKLDEYRSIEKYSKVMHTIAHLSGELKDECSAFDALLACLNAGTLTGAPKVAAMKLIEKHEKVRRGFYGGVVGYLTFSGEMDTAMIIRTAHIKGNTLSFQMGATLLYHSDPEQEYQETMHKAAAFLQLFNVPL